MKIYSFLLGITLLFHCGKGNSPQTPFFILPSSSQQEGGVTTSVGEGATLKKIQLEPPSLTIVQDTHASLSVIAIYSDGSKLDVTQSANWESDKTMTEPDGKVEVLGSGSTKVLKKSNESSSGQATVKARFKGVSPGKTKIRATYENLSAECELFIKGVAIEKIEISHYDFVPINSTVPYKAIAILADGTTQDITDSVTWSVSSNTLGTIDSLGNFTALGNGNVQVIASIGGISFSSETNLSKTKAVSLTLQGNPSIVKGTISRFKAIAIYEDGSSMDVTSQVNWTTENSSIAIVGHESIPGLVYGNSMGVTTIEARIQSVDAKENLKITSPLITGVSIVPKASSPKGISFQYRALATFTDGTIQDVTTQTTWVSENPALLSISNQISDSGLATTLGVGTITVSGSISGQQAFSTFTVTPALLKNISISGELSIPRGLSTKLIATGFYSDNTSKDISSDVTWLSDGGEISNFPEDRGTFRSSTVGSYKIIARLGNVQTTGSVEITPAKLKTISISSSVTQIAKGLEATFLATGILTDNTTLDLTSEVTWITDSNNDGQNDTNVAKITDSLGNLKGLNPGTVKVIAQLGEVKNSTTITITQAELVSISMGSPQSLANGLEGSIRATGIFSDGTTKDITSEVKFFTNGSIYIDQATGKITTNGVGVSTITAVLGTVSTVTTYTVTKAELATLNLTAQSTTIARGTESKIQAIGMYTDGTTVDLSSQITWISDGNGDGKDDSLIAMIQKDGNGNVSLKGMNTGTAIIKGIFEGKEITREITVSPARLVSISIGMSHSIANGLKEQIKAIGTYSDNTTQEITGSVVWSTSGKASISNDNTTPGLFTTAGEETVTITATAKETSASITINVLPAEIVSLTLSQAELTLPRGTTKQINVNGTFTDGTNRDITTSVTFSADSDGDGIDDQAIISVSNKDDSKGSIKALQIGTSTLTVSLGKKSISTIISVSPAELVSISVAPASPTLPKGMKKKMIATGFYTDSTSKDITLEATWNVVPSGSGVFLPMSSALVGTNANEIATVSNSPENRGEVSGLKPGAVDITASFQNVAGKTGITIIPAELISIYVTSATDAKPKGNQEQFSATGIYSDSTTQDLTKNVSWKSDSNNDGVDDQGVVRISNEYDNRGLGTALGEGVSIISANYNGISGSKTFKVTPAIIISLSVESPNSTRPKGLSENLIALATYSDGSVRDVTQNASWSCDSNGDGINDTTLASISNSAGTQGVLSTLSIGKVVVTAGFSGKTASKNIEIQPANLIGLIVSPPTVSIVKGFVRQFTATGYYTDNSMQDITGSVTWKVDSNGDTLDDSLIGAISNTSSTKGLTVGMNPGKATVSATFSGFTYSSILTVLDGTTVGGGGGGGNIEVGEINSENNNFNFQTNRVINISATVINQNGAPVPGALVELYNSVSKTLMFSQISSSTGKISGSVVVNYTDVEILASLAANVTANGSKQVAVPIRREVNGDIKLVVTILGVQVPNDTGTGDGSGSGGGSTGGTGGTGGVVISDRDGDGVPDSKDAYPDDSNRAFKLRIPATGYYTVSFEDLYPKAGDADLNDYTLYMYNEEDINAQGQIIELRSTFQHMAKGAGYNHSLYLRLPPSLSVSNFTTTIYESNGSLNSTLNLTNPGSTVTSKLALYNEQRSNVTGSNNTNMSQSFSPGRIAKTRIRFSTPVSRDVLGTAPYDLYAFVFNTSKELHFPGKYFGNVFGAGKDDYLDPTGFPWAIIVPGEFKWPQETQNIYGCYPKFNNWARSKGALDSDWYLTFDSTKAFTKATGPTGNFYQ